MSRMKKSDKLVSSEEKFEKLRRLLQTLVERRHPYASRMAELAVRPEHIKCYKDLSLLPATTKKDLLDNYPLGWLGCDQRDVARVQATSGTTGRPTVVPSTAADLKIWADNVAWCLGGLADVTADDIIHVCYGYGLFTGGLGLHDGGHVVGAMVVPASGGFTHRQVTLINDIGATVLACTPSYALRIAEQFESEGVKPRCLRLGIFGAEAWSEELRRDIEGRLNIKALDIYGLSEAMGPGVGMECMEQNGIHISDDFIPEIVDPDTLEPVPDGEEGELILTCWSRIGSPVLRYRTRDLTRFLPGDCACGDGTPRIARLRGRTDDMLIMHGVNVFPSQIEAALIRVKGLTPNYFITVETVNGMQELSLTCERGPETSADNAAAIADATAKALKQAVGLTIPITVANPGDLPRSEGKGVHIVRK